MHRMKEALVKADFTELSEQDGKEWLVALVLDEQEMDT